MQVLPAVLIYTVKRFISVLRKLSKIPVRPQSGIEALNFYVLKKRVMRVTNRFEWLQYTKVKKE